MDTCLLYFTYVLIYQAYIYIQLLEHDGLLKSERE